MASSQDEDRRSETKEATLNLFEEKTRIVGCVGATDIYGDDWMISDCSAMYTYTRNCLLLSEVWLSPFQETEVAQKLGGLCIGSPDNERIVVFEEDDTPFSKLTPLTDMLEYTRRSVRIAAEKLKVGERLLFLFFGHGLGRTEDQIANNQYTIRDFCIGENRFGGVEVYTPEMFFEDTCNTKGKITIFSTSCYAGNWKNSSAWTLLAGSDDDTSYSFPESGTLRRRGGVFVGSLTNSIADDWGMEMPKPPTIDEKVAAYQQRRQPVIPRHTLNQAPLTEPRILSFKERSNYIAEVFPSLYAPHPPEGFTMEEALNETDSSAHLPLPHSDVPRFRLVPRSPSSPSAPESPATGGLQGLCAWWLTNNTVANASGNIRVSALISLVKRGDADDKQRERLRYTLLYRRQRNDVINKMAIAIKSGLPPIEQWDERAETAEQRLSSISFFRQNTSLTNLIVGKVPKEAFQFGVSYDKLMKYMYAALTSSPLGLEKAVRTITSRLKRT